MFDQSNQLACHFVWREARRDAAIYLICCAVPASRALKAMTEIILSIFTLLIGNLQSTSLLHKPVEDFPSDCLPPSGASSCELIAICLSFSGYSDHSGKTFICHAPPKWMHVAILAAFNSTDATFAPLAYRAHGNGRICEIIPSGRGPSRILVSMTSDTDSHDSCS